MAERKLTCSYKDIGKTFDRFLTFLRASAQKNITKPGTQPCWHTIFAMGTVVRDIAGEEFAGYTDDFDLPTHRMDEAMAAEVMKENTETWNLQKDILRAECLSGDGKSGDKGDTKSVPTPLRFVDEDKSSLTDTEKSTLREEAGKALRRAYQTLTEDGYPYPGGEGADRDAFPIAPSEDGDGFLWMVVWAVRNPAMFNFILDMDIGSAIMRGGDLRRYDAMTPRVYAVVAPTLEVFILGHEPKPPAGDGKTPQEVLSKPSSEGGKTSQEVLPKPPSGDTKDVKPVFFLNSLYTTSSEDESVIACDIVRKGFYGSDNHGGACEWVITRKDLPLGESVFRVEYHGQRYMYLYDFYYTNGQEETKLWELLQKHGAAVSCTPIKANTNNYLILTDTQLDTYDHTTTMFKDAELQDNDAIGGLVEFADLYAN